MEEEKKSEEKVEYKVEGDSGKADEPHQIPYRLDLDTMLYAHRTLLGAMCKHYGMSAHGRLMCTAALHAIHAIMLNTEMNLLGGEKEVEGGEGQAQ